MTGKGAKRQPTVARGFVGILMLDTRFPRILGDAGNVKSYGRPAKAAVVPGAESLAIVRDGPPAPALIDAFCRAAVRLEARGAVVIVSTCGFLVTAQDQIARSVRVPVMVSALSLFPILRQRYPDRRICILTASKKMLGPKTLAAAGINRADVLIEGMEDCDAFARAILRPKADQAVAIDRARIEDFVTDAARRLVAQTPDDCLFLLECGNLPPYAGAIHAATGCPVYSILDAVDVLAG